MNKSRIQKDGRILKRILKGALVSLGLSIGLCALFSILFVKEIIKEDWLEYIGMAIIIFSVCIGSKSVLNSGAVKWISIVAGFMFLLFIGLIHLLLFRGEMHNIAEIMAAIVIGGILSVLLKHKKSQKRRLKTSKLYR